MTNKLICNRQIRLFISSTFQDMQGERDYLMKNTFPKLRQMAAQRDVTLTVLDLRWGITAEESRSGKVVEICLKEIENSIPFFIGIIGYRYGWRPQMEEICGSDDMKDRFKWVYDDIRNGLSVTEIEIQYGVLRRSQEMSASFYIKKANERPEECDCPEMLEALKRNVRNNGRYPVYDYGAIEELAEKVETEFKLVLERFFPEGEDSERKREVALQHCIVRQLSDSYVPDDDAYRRLDDFIFQSQNKYLTVFGPNGIGKSSLLAYWIEQHTCQESFDILYFFTQGASDVSCKYILAYYKEVLLRKHPDLCESMDTEASLEDIIQKSGKPAIIILDGIEPFQESDNWHINTMDWLPWPPDGSKVIISSSYSEQTFPNYFMEKRESKEESLTVVDLDQERKIVVVEEYLKQFEKHLNASQMGRIVDFALTSNPRILVTLLGDLVFNCNFATLDSSIDGFTTASGSDEFYQVYINHFEQNYGEDLICGAFLLAALPIFGLTEQSFIEILQVKQLDWSTAFCALSPCFRIYEGCIRLADKTFQEVALKYYGRRVDEFRDKIIAYLEDRLRTVETDKSKNRIREELCEQYFHKEDADALYEMISDFEVFLYLQYKRASAMVSFGGAKQIYRYWEWLFSVNPDKYNLGIYLPIAESSPERFLEQAPELTDVAMHAYDALSVLRFVQKALDLVRSGYRLSEKDAEFFAGNLSVAAFVAEQYGLARIAYDLEKVQKVFKEKGTLPEKHAKWEKALRRFIQAESSKEVNAKIEGFKSAVLLLEGSKSYIKDWYVMKYHLAGADMDAGLLIQAEAHIGDIMAGIGEYRSGKYDDKWECFKAEIMGKQVFVKKSLGKYEEALELCEKTICHWEDIEDWRIENGDYVATIDKVEYYSHVYDEIEGLLNNRN